VILIAPSILSADFGHLADQVRAAEQGGANRIHVDVMDGHFVPNLSMGSVVVKGLRPVTRLPLEVHLMVDDPAKFADSFMDQGADSLIVHGEVLPDPLPLVRHIHERGKRVGMAVNPETALDVIEPWLDRIDLALCMTVHPGFGGQAFEPGSPDKIRRLRAMIEHRNPTCELEVDGGIDADTAPTAVRAGARVLVAGTAVYSWPAGPGAAVRHLKAVSEAAM
jgi:ribulose-phosphate 3-epimerase